MGEQETKRKKVFNVAHPYGIIRDAQKKIGVKLDMNALKEKLMWEYWSCMEYADLCIKPRVYFSELNCDEYSRQAIINFAVYDETKPYDVNKVNWHLQNTSQVKYNGAIVIDKENGTVSAHH